jgi:superfamily I DNA and RNA helicase
LANIVRGSTSKPVSSQRLIQKFSGDLSPDGTLYIGYPILGTPTGAFPFDALLLCPLCGLVAFDIVEGRDLGDFASRQDDIFNKLNSKLRQYPALVKRRELALSLHVVTYAPVGNLDGASADYPLLNDETISQFIRGLPQEDPNIFEEAVAALQAMTSVRKSKRSRVDLKPESLGARLQQLNDSIANLDSNQSVAVVETVDGVQRIRGLAGSGKTIVLALKVAYLHSQNPEWKIAVTFNTRSLKNQFQRLINSFVIEHTNEEPNWENIEILHSWGSPSSKGLYYNICVKHGIVYRDFATAQQLFGQEKSFEGACEEAANSIHDFKEMYDAILVDEAQDLPGSFLRLCYSTLKKPKRLVYAYDELQSLTNASMPGPEELFGKNKDGSPKVVFGPANLTSARQDIILKKCYRNSRPLLSTAHALGFGIYREPEGLIQIFEQNDLWEEVGYSLEEGELTGGNRVSLERTPDTSPLFLESHSTIEEIVQFKHFETRAAQDEWLVKAIQENIADDDLLPEDILVVNPDPLRTRKLVGNARAMLSELGIDSSLAGISNSPDVFFEKDTVTFTGIFRAKGNEAGMVYVINADDCFHSDYPAEQAIIRNRLFTAITRSKAWVRVLGVGSAMASLVQEYNRVKNNDFKLNFVYPTDEQKAALKIVNRDMTNAERGRIKGQMDGLASVITSIENGELQIEDLPIKLRSRLQALFQ